MEQIFETTYAGSHSRFGRSKIRIRVFGKSRFAQDKVMASAEAKRKRKAIKRTYDFASRNI